MKNNILIIPIVVALIAGGGGFFAGMKYQQSKRPAQFRMTGDTQGRIPARNGARPIAGEIIKTDDTSITVKLQDGSSKITVVSDATNINKADKGTRTDLITGTQVVIFGSENTDGSISAQNIQINPIRPSQ